MASRSSTSLLLLGLIVLAGCRVSTPGKWETSAMTRVKHSISIGGKDKKNPLSNSAETVEAGKTAFSHYCVACHGLDGQNTGVPFADRMMPPVPSLKSEQVQAYADGQLKWVIENGVAPSGMPAAKGILTDGEMWSIVTYIRHLPPAGTLGEPALYSGNGAVTPCATAKNQPR